MKLAKVVKMVKVVEPPVITGFNHLYHFDHLYRLYPFPLFRGNTPSWINTLIGDSRSHAFKINWPPTLKRQKFTVSRYAPENKAIANITSKPVPDFVAEIGSSYAW